MSRPVYPSDESRRKIKPHVRIHHSAQNHPKTAAVWADNDLLALWLRILMRASERGAAHTGDCLTLSRAQVRELAGGPPDWRTVVSRWERLRKHLGWNTSDLRDTTRTEYVVHVRNFAKKQNLTPHGGGVSLRNSAVSPLPTPHTSSERDKSLSAATPPDPVKDLFETGVKLLGKENRSLIGKLRKVHGDAGAMALLVQAQSKTDPKEWLAATFVRQSPNGDRRLLTVSGTIVTIRANQNIELTDDRNAIDGYELPSGKLSFRRGARWLRPEELPHGRTRGQERREAL